MEESNKKNSRVFYLTLAIVLTVVAILVIAIAVARRSTPEPDNTDTPPTQTTPAPESKPADDQQTNTDDKNENVLPTFSLPLKECVLSYDFCDTVLVFSPTMEDYRTHVGVDLDAALGTEVMAVADGVVSNVWQDHFMGTCVSIEHNGGAVSFYKNLNPVVKEGIVIGASVKAGDVIGAVGESAMNEVAQEPHLHFEMKINDKHVDPKEHIKLPTPEITPDSK